MPEIIDKNDNSVLSRKVSSLEITAKVQLEFLLDQAKLLTELSTTGVMMAAKLASAIIGLNALNSRINILEKALRKHNDSNVKNEMANVQKESNKLNKIIEGLIRDTNPYEEDN